MNENQAEEMERVRRARDKLAERYLYQPEISLIDIGIDPREAGGDRRLVLRVHVKRSISVQALDLPAEIDGIPVRVLTGDYRFE